MTNTSSCGIDSSLTNKEQEYVEWVMKSKLAGQLAVDKPISSEVDAKDRKSRLLSFNEGQYNRGYWHFDVTIPFDVDLYRRELNDPFIQQYLHDLDGLTDDLSMVEFRTRAATVQQRANEYYDSVHRIDGSLYRRLSIDDEYSLIWKIVCQQHNIGVYSFHTVMYHMPPSGVYDEDTKDISNSPDSPSVIDVLTTVADSSPKRLNRRFEFDDYLFLFGGYPALLMVSKIYTGSYPYNRNTGSIDFALFTVDDGIDALRNALSMIRLPTKPLKPVYTNTMILSDPRTHDIIKENKLKLIDMMDIINEITGRR